MGAGILAIFAVAALTTPARAQIAMSGRFVAEARCPALQSIRQKSNPGTISTEPGRSYVLLGRNSEAATHYYLQIPDANPERRWVAIGCGRVEPGAVTASNESTPSTPDAVSRQPHRVEDAVGSDGRDALAKALGGAPTALPQHKQARTRDERPPRETSPDGRYILAASWHSAFCELRPRSRDCQGRRDGGRRDAAAPAGFSLHGLWPQPNGNEYCGVSPALAAAARSGGGPGGWQNLPEPRLRPAVRRDLERVMPGTVSGLDRHEWLRHGTCYGTGADRYFTDAVGLIDALNRSEVARLFAGAAGRSLTADRIRAAFDAAYGDGAGRRVLIDCSNDGGRRLISEIRLSLAGKVTAGGDLPALLRAGEPQAEGCREGIVDAAGQQQGMMTSDMP